MTAARLHRLALTNFRSYRAAKPRARRATWWCWSGRTAPARPICRSDFVFVPGPRLAARDARRSRLQRRRRLLGGVGRGRRRARPCHARHRHRAAARGRDRHHAAMPHRPRAGRLRRRLRRSPAGRLADAGDGRLVLRTRLRAAAFSRSSGARGRCRTHAAASRRWSARCARATGCWKIRARSALAGRGRA